MVGRGGTVDSSQRGYGELGTVEQVEHRSAVVDEGGLTVAWQKFVVRTAVPFLVVLPVLGVITQNTGGAGSVRCTPAISVGSVTIELTLD
jgi:hypothetical protein